MSRRGLGRRGENGAATFEMAIAFPILLVLAVGAAELAGVGAGPLVQALTTSAVAKIAITSCFVLTEVLSRVGRVNVWGWGRAPRTLPGAILAAGQRQAAIGTAAPVDV